MDYPYSWGMGEETPGKLDLSETIELCRRLQAVGLQFLNVSGGNPYFNPHVNRPYDLPSRGVTIPAGSPTSIAASAVSTRGSTRSSRFSAEPLTLTLGANYETQSEHRQGFVNNNGVAGDLRRDEDDTISNTDGYLQVAWSPFDALSLLAGVRYSDVRFRSDDHYVNAGNPDDSGRRSYNHASPVLGAVWHVDADVNVYANYGQGFETPTFAELAYRPVGTGLNLGLQPSVSNSSEIGLKALLARSNASTWRLQHRDDRRDHHQYRHRGTHDVQECGGHAAPRRRGRVGRRPRCRIRRLRDVHVPVRQVHVGGHHRRAAAARAQGCPAPRAFPRRMPMAKSRGRTRRRTGWSPASRSSTRARCTSTIATPTPRRRTRSAICGSASSSASATWLFREFARLNNFTDRNYVGSVIVGDTNGRYFEPVGDPQLSGRSQRQCELLTPPPVTRARRSRCTG